MALYQLNDIAKGCTRNGNVIGRLSRVLWDDFKDDFLLKYSPREMGEVKL